MSGEKTNRIRSWGRSTATDRGRSAYQIETGRAANNPARTLPTDCRRYSTATLRLLGGAQGVWAGAYRVATRTACYR